MARLRFPDGMPRYCKPLPPPYVSGVEPLESHRQRNRRFVQPPVGYEGGVPLSPGSVGQRRVVDGYFVEVLRGKRDAWWNAHRDRSGRALCYGVSILTLPCMT